MLSVQFQNKQPFDIDYGKKEWKDFILEIREHFEVNDDFCLATQPNGPGKVSALISSFDDLNYYTRTQLTITNHFGGEQQAPTLGDKKPSKTFLLVNYEDLAEETVAEIEKIRDLKLTAEKAIERFSICTFWIKESQ